MLWALGTLIILLLMTAASLLEVIPTWLAALAMSIAVVVTALRWARYFLVRMVVDFDANRGEGQVFIERLIPAPNLPETVQLALQDAAEGASSVNTTGLINTLITILEPLKFLRFFSVGDLTLRTRSGNFSMTMFSIQDPEGVKDYIQKSWKKIAAFKAKQQQEAERKEQIERMTIAVAQGLRQAHEELKVQVVVPAEAPAAPALLEPPANGEPPEDVTAAAQPAPAEDGQAQSETGDFKVDGRVAPTP